MGPPCQLPNLRHRKREDKFYMSTKVREESEEAFVRCCSTSHSTPQLRQEPRVLEHPKGRPKDGTRLVVVVVVVVCLFVFLLGSLRIGPLRRRGGGMLYSVSCSLLG